MTTVALQNWPRGRAPYESCPMCSKALEKNGRGAPERCSQNEDGHFFSQGPSTERASFIFEDKKWDILVDWQARGEVTVWHEDEVATEDGMFILDWTDRVSIVHFVRALPFVGPSPCPWCEIIWGDQYGLAEIGESQCDQCRSHLKGLCPCGCGCLIGQILKHPDFASPEQATGGSPWYAEEQLTAKERLSRYRARHAEEAKMTHEELRKRHANQRSSREAEEAVEEP